jgi:hypothetical protein
LYATTQQANKLLSLGYSTPPVISKKYSLSLLSQLLFEFTRISLEIQWVPSKTITDYNSEAVYNRGPNSSQKTVPSRKGAHPSLKSGSKGSKLHGYLSCTLYEKPLKKGAASISQSVDGLKLKSESDNVANTMHGFSAISLINSTDGEEIRLLSARLQNVNFNSKTLLVNFAARRKMVLRNK